MHKLWKYFVHNTQLINWINSLCNLYKKCTSFFRQFVHNTQFVYFVCLKNFFDELFGHYIQNCVFCMFKELFWWIFYIQYTKLNAFINYVSKSKRYYHINVILIIYSWFIYKIFIILSQIYHIVYFVYYW